MQTAPSLPGAGPGTSFPVVCIGMSAGGLEPLTKLFRRLSCATGMAFVVIHHIHNVPTHLPKILAAYTAMPIELASAGVTIRPNHVYILPSGKEMTLTDGLFSLTSRSKLTGWSNVFSVFLDSLANSGHPGIAVVLSGLDSDGAPALKYFNERGGISIVQDPGTADYPQMPRAAIQTRVVDYVLAVDEIAAQLERTAGDFRHTHTHRIGDDGKDAVNNF